MNTAITVKDDWLRIRDDTLTYMDSESYENYFVTQVSQEGDWKDYKRLIDSLTDVSLKQTPYKDCVVYVIFTRVDREVINKIHVRLLKGWNLKLKAVDNLDNQVVLGYMLNDETVPRLNLDWLRDE